MANSLFDCHCLLSDFGLRTSEFRIFLLSDFGHLTSDFRSLPADISGAIAAFLKWAAEKRKSAPRDDR